MTDQVSNVVIVTSRQGTRHVRVLGQISLNEMRDFELLMSSLKSDGHIKDYLITGAMASSVADVLQWAETFIPAKQFSSPAMILEGSL